MSDWQLADGFRFAGVHCGLRPDPQRRDLALIVSDRPAVAAGVFTQNRVCAAPVQVSRSRVPQSQARAIVVCSGNANACTGEQGLADARRMTELTAAALKCLSEQVLVCSTGVIGRPLPMGVFESGIPAAVDRLSASPNAFSDAAHAILTTDTRIKVSCRDFEAQGRTIRVSGFAKGAAMIGPNLATMLGFVLTDAPLNADRVTDLLRDASQQSFNCISVEGHMSTNDTVLLLANGTGPALSGTEETSFANILSQVCIDLAKQIAADAEGAKHLITLEVVGCRDYAEAHRIAKTVAESALVKTAVYGADPNWGRVVSAAGYAGIPFAETELSLYMGQTELYRRGTPLPFDPVSASAYLRDNKAVTFRLVLERGSASCTFYTCDLTEEYIRLNADYTT